MMGAASAPHATPAHLFSSERVEKKIAGSMHGTLSLSSYTTQKLKHFCSTHFHHHPQSYAAFVEKKGGEDRERVGRGKKQKERGGKKKRGER